MRIHFPGVLVLKKKQNERLYDERPICAFSTGERKILQRFRALIIADSLISRRNAGSIISFGSISVSLATISLTVQSLIICWTLWQIKSPWQTWLTLRNIRFGRHWIECRCQRNSNAFFALKLCSCDLEKDFLPKIAIRYIDAYSSFDEINTRLIKHEKYDVDVNDGLLEDFALNE